MASDFLIDLARWSLVQSDQSYEKTIVGAAILDGGRVLGCLRAEPPELAGFWEFPGGKVEPGESESAALVRECAEELGVQVTVGPQVGPDVPLPHQKALLRVFEARLVGTDRPQALEHAEVRWLGPDELDQLSWLPSDQPIVAAVRARLAAPTA